MKEKSGNKIRQHWRTAIPTGMVFLLLLAVSGAAPHAIEPAGGQAAASSNDLDAKVTAFLERSRGRWYDMNVPEQDGRLLYDLVIKGGYKRALEIGTSTGLSGTYIGWALSKTGGKLITVEIDAGRHGEAMANFKEAGLAGLIDARLADAHELVPALEGPFDFVFIDADKEWYVEYAKAVIPKLAPGGCIAAHNVSGGSREGGGRRWGRQPGTAEYYDYMSGLADFETTVIGRQTAVSYRKK